MLNNRFDLIESDLSSAAKDFLSIYKQNYDLYSIIAEF